MQRISKGLHNSRTRSADSFFYRLKGMANVTRFKAVWLGGCLLAAGCGGMFKTGTTGAGVLVAGGVGPAWSAAGAADAWSNGTVRLRPGLVVGIKVMIAGQEEILEPAKRVQDDGRISLPLIGDMDARGCTTGELAQRLEAAYRKFFVAPQVLVDVARDERPDAVSPWGSVTVLGTVRAPGRIAIPPTRDLRVSGAIQRAGGFDSSARKTSIRVTRHAADGTSMACDVNLEEVGARGEREQDLLLEPDDVVFVQERIF